MTKYLERSFSVAVGTPAFQTGWDTIFGRKAKAEAVLKGFPPAILSGLLDGCSLASGPEQSAWLTATYGQDILRRAYGLVWDSMYPSEHDVDNNMLLLEALKALWASLDAESQREIDALGLTPFP